MLAYAAGRPRTPAERHSSPNTMLPDHLCARGRSGGNHERQDGLGPRASSIRRRRSSRVRSIPPGRRRPAADTHTHAADRRARRPLTTNPTPCADAQHGDRHGGTIPREYRRCLDRSDPGAASVSLDAVPQPAGKTAPTPHGAGQRAAADDPGVRSEATLSRVQICSAGDVASLRSGSPLISISGRVVAVDPIGKADPVFLAAARRHLMAHWRYKPAMQAGHAVSSNLVVTLRFQLDD